MTEEKVTIDFKRDESSSTKSHDSFALLNVEVDRLSGDSEFPDLSLGERQKLIEVWRSRDRERMQTNQHRFFQFTNFAAEWRVRRGGGVSVLLHGTIRRRQLGEKEFLKLCDVAPTVNEGFKGGSADIEDVNHLLSMESAAVLSSELENGGGSSFHLVPRIVRLAQERLGGL